MSSERTLRAAFLGAGNVVRGLLEYWARHHFPLELRVSEIRIGDETLFLGNCTDITARKEAELRTPEQ